MTLEQITKMFFPKSWNRFEVPMKKVRTLVNAGFLKTVRLRVAEKRLYVTTKAGAQLLRKKKLSNGLRAIEQVNDKTWEHDEIVTDVRIIFETLLGFTDWIPERILKKKNVRKKVPDAIVGDGKYRYIIEVELNLKNKRYYERVLVDTCLKQYPNEIILYLMKDETEMKWLMNQTKAWERIYFTTVESLNRISYGLEVKNASGKALELPRFHKGSVLFYDPEDPNRDFNLDEDYDDAEDDDEFERWRQEKEKDRRRFEEEERRKEQKQTTEGGSIGQGT